MAMVWVDRFMAADILMAAAEDTAGRLYRAGQLKTRQKVGKEYLYLRTEVEEQARANRVPREFRGDRCTRCGVPLAARGLCLDCYAELMQIAEADAAWPTYGWLTMESMPNPAFHGVGG